MTKPIDIYEFPEGHSGKRTYVGVRGHAKSIPLPYTYKGFDGRNYLHPDYGGDWSGHDNCSSAVASPMILRDMSDYVSPIDGAHVTSRSQHREHMARHGVIEVGNERMPQRAEAPVTPSIDIARSIKRHVDTVKAMPEAEYKARIERQALEAPKVD